MYSGNMQYYIMYVLSHRANSTHTKHLQVARAEVFDFSE